MARPPLQLETYGKIRRAIVKGKHTAFAYYRDSDGVRRPLQRQGKTPAEAERNLVQALRDRLTPSVEYLTRESTLTVLAEQWIEEINTQGRRSISTITRYTSVINAHLNKHVGSLRIREASPARMQRFVDLVAASAGESQARMLGVVLNGMFSLAIRHNAATSNAAADLYLPPVEAAVVRAPDLEDIILLRRLMAEYDARPGYRGDSLHDLAGFADVLAGTGARPGEVLALRWDDIDLEAGKLTIAATVVRAPGKGLIRQDKPKSRSSLRRLTLPRFVVDMLIRRRVNAYCEWVFPSANGTLRWPENVRQQWMTVVTGTPVEWITPGKCRKAAATLIASERGLAAASQQLGHEGTLVTEKRYVTKPTDRPDMSDVLERFAENAG
ncbi:tyrosine-type recombinase/integrase [Plantibacter sp. YIM 135249]|uniref:tyrosine-type recombinase/integrase n=1 Tax=Plantibacter sp. YIM 135249 TaxID=3423918 RepID=UPI003D338CD7